MNIHPQQLRTQVEIFGQMFTRMYEAGQLSVDAEPEFTTSANDQVYTPAQHANALYDTLVQIVDALERDGELPVFAAFE